MVSVAEVPRKSLLTRIDAGLKKLSKFLAYLSYVWFGLLAVFAALDVFNRFVSGGSISWAQQMAIFFMIMLACTYTPVMVQEDTHVRVTFVQDALKGKVKKVNAIVNDIALVFFSILSLGGAWTYMMYLYERNVTKILGTLYFPFWVFGAWGVFLWALMVVYTIVQLAQDIEKSRGGGKK